jgi:hypothetical protein
VPGSMPFLVSKKVPAARTVLLVSYHCSAEVELSDAATPEPAGQDHDTFAPVRDAWNLGHHGKPSAKAGLLGHKQATARARQADTVQGQQQLVQVTSRTLARARG